jgi:hypothetical protein
MKAYFSDWFEVSPDSLEEYGAFNVSLVNDRLLNPLLERVITNGRITTWLDAQHQ